MNPRQELEKVIADTILYGQFDKAEAATEIHKAILRWMDRNEIIFYQP